MLKSRCELGTSLLVEGLPSMHGALRTVQNPNTPMKPGMEWRRDEIMILTKCHSWMWWCVLIIPALRGGGKSITSSRSPAVYNEFKGIPRPLKTMLQKQNQNQRPPSERLRSKANQISLGLQINILLIWSFNFSCLLVSLTPECQLGDYGEQSLKAQTTKNQIKSNRLLEITCVLKS